MAAFSADDKYMDETYVVIKNTRGYDSPFVQRTRRVPRPQSRNPVVSHQRLTYVNGRQNNYVEVQKEMTHFFENWGSSCPGDSTNKVAAQNEVEVFNFLERKNDTIRRLIQTFRRHDPHAIILQFDNKEKKFQVKFWSAVLNKISRKTGCIILPPMENQDHHLKELQQLIYQKNHSCQIAGINYDNVSRRLASTTKHERWVREIQRNACDLDPRSLVESYVNPTRPPDPVISE